MALLNNLVYLVQNVKQHLKLNQVELLCRLVECLITAIVLQKQGIDLDDEPGNEKNFDKTHSSFQLQEIPKEMFSLLKKQLGFVEDFIQDRLSVHLNDYRNVTEWDQELQVSNC